MTGILIAGGVAEHSLVERMEKVGRNLYNNIIGSFVSPLSNDQPLTPGLQFPSLQEVANQGSKVQCTLSNVLHRNLVVRFDATYGGWASGRRNSGGAEGAAFFEAIPTKPYLIVEPHIFRDALRSRKGVPLDYIVERPCKCKASNSFINTDGLHLIVECPRSNHRQVVHDNVVAELVQLIRGAHLNVRRESSCTLQTVHHESRQRTDITILSRGKVQECDVAVAHFSNVCKVGLTHPPPSALLPGAAASKKEKAKRDKYEANIKAANGIFRPLVLEHDGRFGLELRKFVHEMASQTSDISGVPLPYLLSYWTQRIVITMRASALRGARFLALELERKRKVETLADLEEDDLADHLHISLPSSNRPF